MDAGRTTSRTPARAPIPAPEEDEAVIGGKKLRSGSDGGTVTVARMPDDLSTARLDDLIDGVAQRVAGLVADRLTPLVSAAAATPGLLTPTQAADFLQVRKSWLMTRARVGELRSYKVGHYRRFDRRELLEDLLRLTGRVEGHIRDV